MNRASVPYLGLAPSAPLVRATRVAAIGLLAIAVAACSGEPPSSVTATPAPSFGVAQPTPTETPPATVGPPPSPTPPDDSSPLVLDSTLLLFLPEQIDGIALTEDIGEAAVALNDPALPRIAVAVDAGVAVDTGGGNLVFAWVVRLRPGLFADADYRQWRDAYDDGACAAGGGIVGRAEATIGGRLVFVTSCVSALHTYHVWLVEDDILVSASSIGPAGFGKKLVEGLRLPG